MPRFHLGHLRENFSLFPSLNTRVKPWLATKIALQVGLSEPEIEDIKLAAIVHDIGKINVPEDVLHKPTLLTEEEFGKMKSHAAWGAKMLETGKRKALRASCVITTSATTAGVIRTACRGKKSHSGRES